MLDREEGGDDEDKGSVLVHPQVGPLQMAESLLRYLAGDRFEVMSAGTKATFVRPEATKVMAELGVDVSRQESKTLERYLGEPFDYVVTVCDDANEACPAPSSPARSAACTGHFGTLHGSRAATKSASRCTERCATRFRARISRELITEDRP
jgi:hypothetical protein